MVVVESAEEPSEDLCKVPQGPYIVPSVVRLHYTGPGSGTDHTPGQRHTEAFADHSYWDACGKAAVGGHTLSRFVGHKAPVGDELA